MNNDQKFWLTLWGMATIVSIVAIVMGLTYFKHENQLIANLIEQGHNPIATACAFEDAYGKQPSCIIMASKVVK
jgi:hypothetical protein